jgi:ElaB/YqjD/DUF883 family membrane-anchored ribosome-binding protein
MAPPVYPNNQTRFPAYPEPGAGPPADEPRYHPNMAPTARAHSRSSLATNPLSERVGEAMGNALESMKNIPDRLQDMKERFTIIRGRAQEDLAAKASEVAEDVKERASDARNRAEQMARDMRTRTELYASQDPLGFIARAAVVGVVLGIALRIWRDHAD